MMSLPCSSLRLRHQSLAPHPNKRTSPDEPPQHPRLWAAVCLGGGQALAPNAAYGREGFLFAQEQGACELQVLLVLFLRCRAHTPSLPASFSGQFISSMLGLLAAEGPFAKVRLLEPVVEGEFCFFVFFCYDVALTLRPCPSLPLLVCATVAGATGRWFAGRGTLEI